MKDRTKMTGWKARTLSSIGKVVLIKSILIGIS